MPPLLEIAANKKEQQKTKNNIRTQETAILYTLDQPINLPVADKRRLRNP